MAGQPLQNRRRIDWRKRVGTAGTVAAIFAAIAGVWYQNSAHTDSVKTQQQSKFEQQQQEARDRQQSYTHFQDGVIDDERYTQQQVNYLLGRVDDLQKELLDQRQRCLR